MNENQKTNEFFGAHGVEQKEVVNATIPYCVDSIYSIFDTCSLSYDAPFLSVNDGTAIRYVKDALIMRDSLLRRHPEDYQLYKLGSLDKSSGVIYPSKIPVRVACLNELITKTEQ